MLCATIHEGKIIVGCQYGLLVFWDIVQVCVIVIAIIIIVIIVIIKVIIIKVIITVISRFLVWRGR